MTGTKTMKQIENNGERSILLCAYNCIQVEQPTKYITTEMNNQLKYICVHICATRYACMQYQTCIGIVKHMDTPNDHNRNIGRLPGSRKFPSTFAFFELHCCSEIPRYPNFSPRNLGLQVRNSRHCAGHSLVEDLCFRLLCLRECWQNVGVQIWEFQTHK